MTTVLEKFNLSPVKVSVPKQGQYASTYKIQSDCPIGIEVEVENASDRAPGRNSLWHVVTDGSLRNGGAEFVSHPIAANYAPQLLHELMETILRKDCCFSPRTSVHIHMNAQDLELHQVVDFVLVYSIFERLFYKFAGRGRVRNIFCVPITDTQLVTGLAERGIGHPWSKYTGLNLAPLRTGRDGETGYGTIEFRQMHGTFNIEKLCIWIDLITTLKLYIQKTSTKEIRQLVSELSIDSNYPQLLQNIFGDKAIYLKLETVDEIYSGVLVAKSALLSAKSTQRITGAISSKAPFFKFKGN